MRVLVIPEDFRKDQYILKPIISAMMSAVGKPRARLQVCQEPLLGGVGEALKWVRIQEILLFYQGMIDLYLLIIDRDGKAGRRQRLDELEELAAKFLPANRAFFAENAWQEVEVWLLAGHKLPSDWSWQAIRAERDPKEFYFDPLVEQRGLHKKPSDATQILAKEAASQYNRIRQLCPEDIKSLEERIRAWLS